jgi:hypothetical protein
VRLIKNSKEKISGLFNYAIKILYRRGHRADI